MYNRSYPNKVYIDDRVRSSFYHFQLTILFTLFYVCIQYVSAKLRNRILFPKLDPDPYPYFLFFLFQIQIPILNQKSTSSCLLHYQYQE